MLHYKSLNLIVLILVCFACKTGKLRLIASLDSKLDEASAIETIMNSELLWTIEDSGNDNSLYGLNHKGGIVKSINISNATNEDWEDLTSDSLGNIYIGDFGNNNKKRKKFTIYKVNHPETLVKSATAEEIHFKLPENVKSEDFEGFFFFDDHFYVFSKENSSSILLKIPNQIGEHVAELITDFNLEGKHHKITSAAISPNKETVVLLNHDKLWKITNFKPDNFFQGRVEELKFNHDSQKEGICFKDNSTVYITDERNQSEGGNIYTFKLNK